MIGADHEQSGELTLGSCGGLEGDGVHASDFEEAVAERLHDAQSALRNFLGLIGMSVGEAFDASDKFVDARVVLHGAGAKRVHAEIDGVVPGGEAGEVADDFNLADFRHVAQILALGFAQEFCGVDFGDVEGRKFPGGFAGRGFFEDEAFVLADVAGGFASHVLHS